MSSPSMFERILYGNCPGKWKCGRVKLFFFFFLLLFCTGRPATRRHPLMFFECDIIISVNAKNTHNLVDACERRFSRRSGNDLLELPWHRMTGVTSRITKCKSYKSFKQKIFVASSPSKASHHVSVTPRERHVLLFANQKSLISMWSGHGIIIKALATRSERFKLQSF